MGRGWDLSYRIATRRRDEIAVVAHEVNRMCDRLSELQERERAQALAKTQALPQLRHADRLAALGIASRSGRSAECSRRPLQPRRPTSRPIPSAAPCITRRIARPTRQ